MSTDEKKTFTLYIQAYSPETIPMARLAEYMQALASMLGHEHGVHFSHLEPGSTQVVTRIDREEIPKVEDRLDKVRRGEASQDAMKASDRIDLLLAEDNARGYIYENDNRTAQIIQFPGITRPKPVKYGPFVQEGSIDGILVSVAGVDQTIHIQLQNGDMKYTGIDTDRDTARRLAQHFFEPVRLFGSGRWLREESGVWSLKRFKVVSFDVLRDQSLIDALNSLRDIEGSKWKEIDDPLAELANLRGDKDGLH